MARERLVQLDGDDGAVLLPNAGEQRRQELVALG